MPEFGDVALNSAYGSRFTISMEKKIERLREQSRLRGDSFTAFADYVLQILIVLRHREGVEADPAASESRRIAADHAALGMTHRSPRTRASPEHPGSASETTPPPST